MDNKTEEGLKRIVQDYEYETTGIPQRLDHVLYDGYAKGLAQAERNQALFDMQTEEIVELTKKNIRNATYEQLKQNYFDYNKLYNGAVRSLRSKIAFFRFLVWLFGLGSLGSACLGIGSCFFDSAETVPELLKPFYEGGGMLGMILFFVFGVIWWILYAIYSHRGDPEISGMSGRYLQILGVIENKLRSKKFITRFKSDPDFSFLNEDEDDYDEEELYEDELGNYYADDDPENPKNQKENRGTTNEKYGFYGNDTNLDKTMKIKEYCKDKKTSRIILTIIPIIILVGVIFSISLNSISSKANNLKENMETNNLIENKEDEQENTKAKSYIAENGKEFNINALELNNITEQIESSSNLNNKETENTSDIKQNTNNITSSNNNIYTNNNNNNNSNDNTSTTLEQIKLPNLINLAEAEAISKLKSLGLEYSITRNTKQVAFDNTNAGKSIVTNIIDKKDYYSQYDRVYLEVNQYKESGISIGFIINTKELVNHVKVYVDNKEYSAYYFPNMSSETFYANGRKSVNIKIVLNDYSENFEIYNKNINLYEANKTVSEDGYTYIDIGTIDYKP